MPQNQNTSQQSNPEQDALYAALNGFDPSKSQTQRSSSSTTIQQSLPETQMPQNGVMYTPMGGGTYAMPTEAQPISDAALDRYRAHEQIGSAGPYASTAQGEAQTAQQYKNRLNSPYMMFGANNRFAQGHPRLAGMLDNAFLGGSLVNEAHQRALAAGGGVEGAGGAIGDVMSGILGIPQAKLQYRQGLEQIALQHQQAEANLRETAAKTLQEEAVGARAMGQNAAQENAQKFRGQAAAAVGATGRMDVATQNNLTRLQIAQQADATKRAIQTMKDRTSRMNTAQRAQYHESFLNGLNTHLNQINARYEKMESTPIVENGIARMPNAEEKAQLEQQRQADIADELAYGEYVSQGAFGKNLLDIYQKKTGATVRSKPGKTAGPSKQAYLQNGKWYDAQTHKPIQ